MISGLSRILAGRKSQRWTTLAYACCLLVVLLAPFHFRSPIVHNGARWIAGLGIDFTAPGIIRSRSPATKLTARLTSGTGFTLEVWAAGSGTRLHGPARIVSYSLASWARNFTLGQEALDLVMLLRTTRTNLSGYKPHVRISKIFASTALQHIVVTYDFKQQEIYINGRRRLRTTIPGGGFANWDAKHYLLLLGNEATGDEPWLGKLLLVAVYNRALPAGDIKHHFKAGAKGSSQDDFRKNGAVALYQLAGEPKSQIVDSSGTRPPLDLWKPHKFIEGSDGFLSWPTHTEPTGKIDPLEVIANVALFLPFGFLLHAKRMLRGRDYWTSAAVVLALGMLVSLSFESMQYFLPGRTSSLLDVLANASGTVLGIACQALWARLMPETRLDS
jgi:VanZ family protein